MYERQDHVDEHRTLLPFQETKAAVGQVHAPLSKKPQTVGRPTLAPPKGGNALAHPGTPLRPSDPAHRTQCTARCRACPCRPVATCTRVPHPGLPRSLSPILSPRPPETQRNATQPEGEGGGGESRSRLPAPPTGTPRGRGAGGRRRRRRLKRAGRHYLLPCLPLPLMYYSTALRPFIYPE
jgi:hypothetical protein